FARRWLRIAIEQEAARLLPGVSFDLQRAVVIPRDVETGGHAHQARGPVREARAVLGRVPCVADARAFRVQRHACEVAFRRRHHPPPPVFVDDRYPVAGEIDRRAGTWRLRWLRRSRTASTLRR